MMPRLAPSFTSKSQQVTELTEFPESDPVERLRIILESLQRGFSSSTSPARDLLEALLDFLLFLSEALNQDLPSGIPVLSWTGSGNPEIREAKPKMTEWFALEDPRDALGNWKMLSIRPNRDFNYNPLLSEFFADLASFVVQIVQQPTQDPYMGLRNWLGGPNTRTPAGPLSKESYGFFRRRRTRQKRDKNHYSKGR